MLYKVLRIISQEDDVIDMWNNVIPMLRPYINIEYKTISIDQAYRYRGDFYGLLKVLLEIEEAYIYPTMLINGFRDSTDYDGNNTKILIPDLSTLDTYLSVYLQQRKE